MTVGDRIRKARLKAGLSPAKLGELVGVSRQQIRNWENNVNVPRGANARKLVSALEGTGLTLTQLNPYGGGGTSFVDPNHKPRLVLQLQWSDLRRLVGGRVDMHGLKRPTYLEADRDNENLNGHCVALRVEDDSMEPRFQKGEIFIIDPGLSPQDSDYVVARLHDGTHVLRRFLVRPSGGYDLQAGKAKYRTLSVDPSNTIADIIGVVVEHRQRMARR
jgi:transcriptional regulator with XRE-family HTH domain